MRPADVRASRICGPHDNRLAGEWVTEDIGQVVPNCAWVQSVGKVGLRAAVVQTVVDGGDLQRDPTGRTVMVQYFGVAATCRDGLLRANAAANGPQVDWEVALVGHDSVANGAGKRSQSGNRGNNCSREVHFVGRWSWFGIK